MKISSKKLLVWLKREEEFYRHGFESGKLTSNAEASADLMLVVIGEVERMKKKGRKS